jgi:pterin-4a-carbinolamine dehydratase
MLALIAMARDLDSIATHTLSRDAIAANELQNELDQLGSRWSGHAGSLQLRLDGPMGRTGAAAAAFAALAEELEHHPKIVLEDSGLTLTIKTNESKAITVIDLVYAARAELWLRGNGWPT